MSVRGWAWVTLLVLVAGLVVTAALLVPWHRPPAPRSDQLAALAELPADKVARARHYRAELRLIAYPSMILGIVAALILGLTPLGAKLVDLVPGPWWVKAVGGGLLVLFLADLVTLPLAAVGHRISVRYGLSTQGWGAWSLDLLKGYAITAILGAIVLFVFFGVTRLAPNWWWAWAAAGAAGLVVLLSFIFPLLVEPVFNKFTPMEDGPLRTRIVAMAAEDGVPVRDVLVADASRRTRAVNAYVSGLGPTRRVVVYDTLLREAPEDEVVSVVAHELGHAKRNDVLTGTLIGALGSATLVVLLFLIGGWTGLLRRAGVESLTDPRAIGLLLALGTVAGLVGGPIQAYVSRSVEARADEHALTVTGDPRTFEEMQKRLALVNLGDPDPPAWEQTLFGSHPSTVERIAAARAYARAPR
ncbi:MAG: M48 family metallopeptidase [Hamadaea sp.]|nr:M48 family metallopeptidase [Hamadaea sp.]